ncbi:hypothetical protein DFJ74DRAFT_682149 [Hyaloraphidium curvatum]|nr:hypothetical protein DFJ74DRAFT_682149 [Hyaloraphidium curvatum]
MPILTIATLTAKPERLAEVLPIMNDLVVETNKEPGCIEYEYYLNPKKPGEIVFIEQWQDEAAVEFHRASPHMQAVNAKLKGKMAKAVVGRRMVIPSKL